ncbi:MAG: hypothetical protein LAP38_11955 [Acidobacteriia bacterium]|nr:hypothetical protein [Terriglobia bacterium]
MGSINNLSSNYLQSVLGSALQNSGLTTGTAGSSGTSSVALQTDQRQLSPFAQVMSALQQLQQSDPAKYQQVTKQIAANLQSAAQTAQAEGNTTEANRLSQLAQDFTSASQSGQLPNIQDLAKAIGGHHHHHHHAHAPSSDPDGDSSASNASSSASTSQTLSQLLSAFQANAGQNDSLNPVAIILNTLSDAGISSSNGA